MKLYHALILIGALTFAGGAIGGGLGYVTGNAMPEYYRNLLRPRFERDLDDRVLPRTDPVAVAMTLGSLQGAGVGLVVALVLVGVFVWKGRRTDLQETVDDLCRELHELKQIVDRLERNRQQRVSAPLPEVPREGPRPETFRPGPQS